MEAAHSRVPRTLHLGTIIALWGLLGIETVLAQAAEDWVARYDGPASRDDYPVDLQVDGSGHVYTVGISPGTVTDSDYATVKHDTSGTRTWIARYDGPASAEDRPAALAVDDSGNVYVTGMATVAEGNSDYMTLKYNSAGELLWAKSYDGPAAGEDAATALAVDRGGNVYVTGGSAGAGTGGDFATVKYDPAGNELWVARYNRPDLDDRAAGMAVDPSGNVYVVGSNSCGWGCWYFTTIKYDSLGRELWKKEDFGNLFGALTLDAAGNAYVACESGCWVTVTKYDPAGNEIYQFLNVFCFTAMAVDGPGNLYLTGGSLTARAFDAWGNERWTIEKEGSGIDFSKSLAVDPAGNVFVSGWTDATVGAKDFATIRLDPEGNLRSRVRYAGPGNGDDVPTKLVIDGAGSAIVTGYSQGLQTGHDFVTVKHVLTPDAPFLRGDANGDGAVNLSDAIHTLLSLFIVNLELRCGDATDSNDDGAIDLSDAVHTLRFLFLQGNAPPPPGFSTCGRDPTEDVLGCATFLGC